MKSTYSVAITATICYDKAEWQVRFSFPAAIDFDAFDDFIEDIESRKALPSVDEMITILQSDDEPDIKIKRIYKISQEEYNTIVRDYYDDESDMFADCMDSVQPSFCRNCGAEGRSVEPDAVGYTCESCGQSTLHSIASILNLI